MEWKDIEILIDGIPVKVEPYEYNMMPISEPVGTNLVADFLIKQGVLKEMPQVNDIVSKQKIDVSDLINDATKWVGWQDLNMPCVYVNGIDIDTPYYSLPVGSYTGVVLKYKHADGWYKKLYNA